MELRLLKEVQPHTWKSWLCVALLLLAAMIVSKDKHQIFLILLASVIPAFFASDRSNKVKLAVAAAFAVGFILIKGLIFEIHKWQLEWEFSNPEGLFGWQIKIDPLLYSIPFNDGMFIRQFKAPWIDEFMVPIYVYGFTTPLLVLVVYYVMTHRADKIVHALFCAHAVQYLVMLPFHFWVDGHQTWMIQNIYEGTTYMDPILGYRKYGIPTIPSLNHVFPSMHSSIAATMIILAWREKSLLLKWTFAIFNVLVIISTIYLGIHWIVDMIAGILIGWAMVKFADWVMARKKVQFFLSYSEEMAENLLKRRKAAETVNRPVSM